MKSEKDLNKMEIELSIILPIYNVKQYLVRCVRSIINQDIEDYELILVDDGSTDGSGEICDELAAVNKKIKVIHKANGGLSSARNAGLDVACGTYIFWIDSDDWIADGALKRISEEIKSSQPDILKFNYYRNTSTAVPTLSKVKAGIYIADSKEKLIEFAFREVSSFGLTAWSHIYKRNFLINNSLSFISERQIGSEDFLFNYQAYIKASKIAVLDDYLYYYDLRQGSLSQYYRGNLYILFTNLYVQLLNWLSKNNIMQKYESYAAYFYVGRIYGCITAEYKWYKDKNIRIAHDNVKAILKTKEFHYAIEKSIVIENNIKKKIIMLLCKYNLESLVYMIFK